MIYPKYDISRSKELDVFEFVSVGVKGSIDKIIRFEPTYFSLIYNLAFGDKKVTVDGDNQYIEIDDIVISDNGDRDMILATVADAVYIYTFRYPERWVIFMGSNEVRTRLYRMAIVKNYNELCIDFSIFGVLIVNEKIIQIPFDSNTSIDGFIVKRK